MTVCEPDEKKLKEELERAKMRPVDNKFRRTVCAMNRVKENERYSVTDEFYSDSSGVLKLALIDFQTKEKVFINIIDLTERIFEHNKERKVINIKQSEADINRFLIAKIENGKPYITQLEVFNYFRNWIGNNFVYFTYSYCYGISEYELLKVVGTPYKAEIKDHKIINAHLAHI